MQCDCRVKHSHPLCKNQRFQLFAWWHQKHQFNLDITATTLGVSRRTAQRWISRRDVPLSTAVLLEQIQHGAIFEVSVYRAGGRVRHPWRLIFPDRSNRPSRLLDPTFAGKTFAETRLPGVR